MSLRGFRDTACCRDVSSYLVHVQIRGNVGLVALTQKRSSREEAAKS